MNLREIADLVSRENAKMERVKTAKYAVGYAAGMVAVAAAGITIGLLISPKPGKETREDIKKKAADVAGAIKDIVKKDKVDDSSVQA
jgi:gas vesicle protein